MVLTVCRPADELSLGDFEPTPALDSWLTALAWRAKSDSGARDALFSLLGHKINRFAGLQQRRMTRFRVSDFDDVCQESFLVFCSVVRTWPGAGNFCGYFFASFPRRLSDAMMALEYGRYRHSQRFASLEELRIRAPWLWPDSGDIRWLITLAEGLPDRAKRVLVLRIAYRMSFVDIARMMALDYRTIHRDWLMVMRHLRHEFGAPAHPAGGAPRRHVTNRQRPVL
ncbi:MAG TPA: sigma-70 family RNA polymerase sigma factor [Thermomicrobiaceae bacterium]|nr:sigma-70 family RNA polymerase sigma factor [Thermomicrobiaceae bacterium]